MLAAILFVGLAIRAGRNALAARRAADEARAAQAAVEERLDQIAATLADEDDDAAVVPEALAIVRLSSGCAVVLPEETAVRLALAMPGYEGGVGRRLS